MRWILRRSSPTFGQSFAHCSRKDRQSFWRSMPASLPRQTTETAASVRTSCFPGRSTAGKTREVQTCGRPQIKSTKNPTTFGVPQNDRKSWQRNLPGDCGDIFVDSVFLSVHLAGTLSLRRWTTLSPGPSPLPAPKLSSESIPTRAACPSTRSGGTTAPLCPP